MRQYRMLIFRSAVIVSLWQAFGQEQNRIQSLNIVLNVFDRSALHNSSKRSSICSKNRACPAYRWLTRSDCFFPSVLIENS
jgi:hypothetical protein